MNAVTKYTYIIFCCTCNKYLSKILNVTCKTALLRYATQDLTTSLLRATFQIGNEITVVEISVGLYRRLTQFSEMSCVEIKSWPSACLNYYC